MATIDLRKPRQINFLTMEADLRSVTEKLVSSQNILKLLYYNTADALEQPDIEDNDILVAAASKIRIVPEVAFPETLSSFIIITLDNFSPNATNQDRKSVV